MTTNELAERAHHIIRANRYLTMATCDGQEPWAAPLAYVVEPNYSLIYYSAINSRHSKDVIKNPTVACAIFDSTASSDDADGIQFSGSVEEVSPDEVESVTAMYFEQSFPDEEVRKRWLRLSEDFTGDAIQRFYRITPLEIYTIDLTHTKVDRRVKVDLNTLKKIPIS